MKAAFYTLGCKVNKYETQAMTELLQRRGFIVVGVEQSPDIIIVNSCTVTSESDRKTRQITRKLKRDNPEAIIVLTGCMTQAVPEKSDKLPEADIILGNNSNIFLADEIEKYIKTGVKSKNIIPHQKGDEFKGGTITCFEERERAFVKIQDGCNRFCSYCIIPYARGRVRSKMPEVLREELRDIASKGYREIVLVGINLSSYGSDIGTDITSAVKIACDIPEIERVRLGSLEPDHITEDILSELKKLPKFCPQFHLSLQSGCDRTLKKMNRHYTADEYEKLINKIRDLFPDATVTTDVMVGFPEETEEDFNCSVEFVKKIGFEKVHVFPYSPRENTRAAEMAQINKAEKERRAEIMIEETSKIREAFLREQIGKTFEILIESSDKNGFKTGYTKNYIPVLVKCDNKYISTIQKVKIISSNKENCCGEMI